MYESLCLPVKPHPNPRLKDPVGQASPKGEGRDPCS